MAGFKQVLHATVYLNLAVQQSINNAWQP